jgi:hypothetical protein
MDSAGWKWSQTNPKSNIVKARQPETAGLLLFLEVSMEKEKTEAISEQKQPDGNFSMKMGRTTYQIGMYFSKTGKPDSSRLAMTAERRYSPPGIVRAC